MSDSIESSVLEGRGLAGNVDFVLFLSGRVVSNIGDSLYFIASMWLVYDLTGSAFFTGLAGFLVRIPAILSFLTGPLVDRWPSRQILVVTQSVNGVLVMTVPVVHWMGELTVWVLFAVLPVVTFVNRFVYPVQDAALPRVVAEERLTAANSLMSAGSQATDLVFNAVSGVLIGVVGAIAMFIVNSVTFAVAVLLFAGLSHPALTAASPGDGEASSATDGEAPPATDGEASSATDGEASSATGGEAAESGEQTDAVESGEQTDGDTAESGEPTDDAGNATGGGSGEGDSYLAQLSDGFSYLRGSLISVLLLGLVTANLTGGAMFGVLPAYSATIGGADAYGFLMAAFAGGTLTGTLLASRVDHYSFGRFTAVGLVFSGAMLAVAMSVTWFPLVVACFYVTFVPVGAFNVFFFTILQLGVEDEMLGRVSALVRSIGITALPVGSVLGGTVATVVGARPVILWWTVGGVFFGLYVAVRSDLRSLPAPSKIDPSTLGVSAADAPAAD